MCNLLECCPRNISNVCKYHLQFLYEVAYVCVVLPASPENYTHLFVQMSPAPEIAFMCNQAAKCLRPTLIPNTYMIPIAI